jgi:Flp pilus assembly pilin Flp
VWRAILRAFHKSSAGQDLAEYCLITALAALVGLGIFIHLSGGMQAIWGTASTTLAGSGNGQSSGTSSSLSSTPSGNTH